MWLVENTEDHAVAEVPVGVDARVVRFVGEWNDEAMMEVAMVGWRGGRL